LEGHFHLGLEVEVAVEVMTGSMVQILEALKAGASQGEVEVKERKMTGVSIVDAAGLVDQAVVVVTVVLLLHGLDWWQVQNQNT